METCTVTKSKFLTSSGKLIPVADAEALINAHKQATFERRTSELVIDSYFFGKEKLQRLLDETDATGLRIHFGLNETGQQKLIIFPADENGNDIHIKGSFGESFGLDFAVPCPPYCPVPPCTALYRPVPPCTATGKDTTVNL